MADEPQRTVHAQAAFHFSDVFAFKFQNMSFGGQVPRKLRLAEPEMSTDGGRKARQPIILEATETERKRALVCGWVDVPKKVCELRSHAYVKQQLEARSESVDVSREEWDRLVQELTSFMRIQAIDTSVVDPAPKPAPAPPKPDAPVVTSDTAVTPLLAMLAIGILIGFSLGYLVFGVRG